MASLAQFPPEILSIISSSLNGFDIAHLWLSGNSMLMARMESGGITRFDLSLAQEFNCKWPTLISRFKRLESLSIRPKTSFHRIWFRDVDLGGISPTLRHLELEFVNLEFSLFGLPFVASDPHPDPIWSPPTEGEMVMSLFPLADHFPRLESVTFRSKMKFPSFLLPMLPHGLISLSLPYSRMDYATLRQLPPQLTKLELPALSEMPIDENGLSLPSSLTHLDLKLLDVCRKAPSLCFPPNLTFLSVPLSPKDGFIYPVLQLPSTLLYLAVYGWCEHFGRILSAIPSTLLHLEGHYATLPSEPKILPPRLETLVALRQRSDSLSELPSTLTHLSLKEPILAPECLLSLPSCIRVLTLNIDFLDLGTPYSFVPTLERLHVNRLDVSTLAMGLKLSFLSFLTFSGPAPLSLQHLTSLTTLSCVKDEKIDQVLLPMSLTELKVFCFSADSFLLLPRGLQLLRISAGSDLSSHLVGNLPPGLIELTVFGLNESNSLSDASSALLPRSLEVLHLSKVCMISDNAIADLPRHLRRCCLGMTPLLTNASIPLFPRQLIHLELKQATLLSNACIQHLPRSLYILGLHGSPLLTESCFADFPPSLNHFNVPNFRNWKPIVSNTEKFLKSFLEGETSHSESI